MAVQPLFLPSMDDLKARLRLTGVQLPDAGQPLIDAANRKVRVQLNARLGASRVGQLLNTGNFSVVDNPTTEAEVIRATADEVEERWTWLELSRVMPLKFFDASGDDLEQYNQEGIFRSIDPERLKEAQQRAEDWIEQMLAILSGEVSLGESGSAQVFIQGDAPGGRLFPLGTLVGQNCRLWGNPKIPCEDDCSSGAEG